MFQLAHSRLAPLTRLIPLMIAAVMLMPAPAAAAALSPLLLQRVHWTEDAWVAIRVPQNGAEIPSGQNLTVEVEYSGAWGTYRFGRSQQAVEDEIETIELFMNGSSIATERVSSSHGTVSFMIPHQSFPDDGMTLQARAYSRVPLSLSSRSFFRGRFHDNQQIVESEEVRVVFAQTPPSPSASDNLLVNGGFESGLDPWIFQNWPDRGTATVTGSAGEFKEGDSGLRVDITNPDVYWMVQVRQELSFSPREYTLSFWAKAASQRTIIINAHEEGTWTNLGLWQEPVIATGWTFYTYRFTPGMSTNNGQLVFNMGTSSETVWLDGVTLTALGSQPPPPPPPPPVSPGILSVTAYATTPVAGMLPANADGLTVGVLGLMAQDEAVRLERLSVRMNPVNGGGPDQLDKLWLSDGIKSVGITPVSSDVDGPMQVVFDMSADPFLVPVNAFLLLTLKVDTANIDRSNNSKGYSGEGFKLDIRSTDDVTVTGSETGLRPVVVGTPNFNEFTVYRSVPIADVLNPRVTVPLSGNGVYDLFRFTVSANPKGPIGLYKLTFGVFPTTVNVSGFELWDSSYSTAPVATNDAVAAGSSASVLEFLFDTDGNGTGNGGEFREVPAGATRTYTLKGTVAGFSPNSSPFNGITTVLAGDMAFPSPVMQSAAGIDAGDQDDFIWTDFSHTIQYNTSTATNTAEWTNGRRVQGLPSTTSTAQAI